MKTVLVTGGGGFLGKSIIKQLLQEGDVRIKSLSRGAYPELTQMGIETIQMDPNRIQVNPFGPKLKQNDARASRSFSKS